MLKPFITQWRLFACLLLVFCKPLWADDSSMINTLYNSDVDFGSDEGHPRFTLDGEIGILAASGNTETTSFKGALRSEHDTAHWNNNYSAEMLYTESLTEDDDGETSTEVSAQRFFGYVQFDYKLKTPGRRTFMYADYEDDRFNGYDYRASLAGGWSRRMWKDDESSFRYSVGPGYAFVAPEDGTETNVNNGFIVRASGEYQYEWHTGALLRQFMSAEVGEDNIKTRSETALSASLFDSLAMKLGITLSYDTQPLDDSEGLNTETTVSIVYRFF
ncbi:DUF481 domain-containing protein [Alteromonas sp. C1M14]|nr:DUF481 domain-containing protein [Alteromonas sp. C1M14]